MGDYLYDWNDAAIATDVAAAIPSKFVQAKKVGGKVRIETNAFLDAAERTALATALGNFRRAVYDVRSAGEGSPAAAEVVTLGNAAVTLRVGKTLYVDG